MLRTAWLAIPLLFAGCGARSGISPLIQAARDGRVKQIPALAKQGADLNQRAGVNGWTPLMHAIHKHQKGSVVALLDSGADINARGSDGSTPLMMASGYGYTDIVKLLLDRGADARAQMSDGMNALTFAVLGANDIDRFTMTDCQGPTVRALIEHNPDLKLKGSERVMRCRCGRQAQRLRGLRGVAGQPLSVNTGSAILTAIAFFRVAADRVFQLRGGALSPFFHARALYFWLLL